MSGRRGPVWPDRPGVRPARALVALASRLVPFARRREWREEWEGELWALAERGEGAPGLVRFGAAGVGHALFERREEEGRMGGLGQDVSMALRRARRNPGFTVVVVAVLALGIGANTALFSAVRAALLEGPPWPDVDRMVVVDLTRAAPGAAADTMPWSYPKFEAARERFSSLEALAAYAPSSAKLTRAGEPARLPIEFVTPSYFELLGASPLRGRGFTADEDTPAEAPVAVLSERLWVGRFGADPDIVGRTIRLDDAELEVVGVMPAGFAGLGGSAEAWVPFAAMGPMRGDRRLRLAQAHWVRIVGRRRPGVSASQSAEEAASVGREITALFPDAQGGTSQAVALTSLSSVRVNPLTRTAVVAVGTAAVLFLLIACANVAGLLLARQSARRGDAAVRTALGAGRGRLVRESLVESSLLAGLGGVLGVALAFVGGDVVAGAVGRALDLSGGRGLTYLDPAALRPDAGVVGAALAIALVVAGVTGGLPAWFAGRRDPIDRLRRGSGAVGSGSDAGAPLRGALVAGQLAVTVVLMAAAGLTAASLGRLSDVSKGFSNDRVAALSYDRGPGFDDADHHRFIERAIATLDGIPGVTSASAVTCAPLAGRCEIVGLSELDGQPPTGSLEGTALLAYAMTDGYFRTIGTELLEGRTFGPQDGPDDVAGVILNRTAAERLVPGGSALGHRLKITHSLTSERSALVVGVVDDVRYGGLEQPVLPAVYLSERQASMPYGTLMVATEGDPKALLSTFRSRMAEMAPDMPLDPVTTLADLRGTATARTRVIVGLLVAFATSGLLLSALGLYGLVSWTVSRRTREVGLRMALGAGGSRIVGLVTRGQMALAVAGAGLGLVAAVAAGRSLEGLLFETEPADPLILGGTVVLLLAVAALAAFLPARRAARIQPTEALRAD